MKKNKKQSANYIFPDFLAKIMAKVDLRTQYEASMLSMSLMSIGLTVTITYLVIFFEFKLWYKILLAINGIAGLIFMWSYITTIYQQYRSYMGTINFQKELKGGVEIIDGEKTKN